MNHGRWSAASTFFNSLLEALTARAGRQAVDASDPSSEAITERVQNVRDISSGAGAAGMCPLRPRASGKRKLRPSASVAHWHKRSSPCRPHTDLHFEVTDQLLKLKFFPPGDEVISTPYWTLPTFMSPKYPFDLIHCRILLMSTVPLLVFEVRSNEMTL